MVTVVIPCRNGEKWVKRCIESLLQQTYEDIEIIVVDDGSADNTAEVVKSIQDDRVRMIWQSNAGVSSARNRGIEEAKGEWIVFVDSDDYVEKTYLQSLLSLEGKGCLPTVGFAENGEAGSVPSNNIYKMYHVDSSMPEEYLVGGLGKEIGFSCWNKLFCKQVLIEHNIRFNTGLELGEDMIFVLRYLCYCHTVKLDQSVQYHYCINATSAVHASQDQSKRYENTLQIMRDFLENGYFIPEEAICRWCLEVIPYILLNPYVTQMSFFAFRNYLKKMKNGMILDLAICGNKDVNLKKSIMRWALQRKSAMWLYLMVQAQSEKKRRRL